MNPFMKIFFCVSATLSLLVLLQLQTAFAEQSVTTEVLFLDQRQLGPEILKILREAKKNIRVCLNRWEFSKNSKALSMKLFTELVLQAKKGLDVEVLLDQALGGDSDPNILMRKALFEAGVLIFEDSKQQKTRCNMLLVDDFTAVTGSFDWTEESLKQNTELALWVESRTFYKILRKRFEDIKALGLH